MSLPQQGTPTKKPITAPPAEEPEGFGFIYQTPDGNVTRGYEAVIARNFYNRQQNRTTTTAGSVGGSTGTSFLDAINSGFSRVPQAPGLKLGFLFGNRPDDRLSDTILTGPRGVVDNAPVRQRKAGGQNKNSRNA
jgi:hypothetical protein